MAVAIGIDLGGSNVRAGLCSGDSRVMERIEETSRAKHAPDELRNQLVDLVKTLSAKTSEGIVAVGVGVPGIHDSVTGVIHQSPHFPEWRDYPLRSKLAEKLKCRVETDNDANMWALGEARFGAGQGKDDVLCLTLGTGIGGGIIVDGQIYHGERGFAGEVGHIVVEAEGPPCSCGNRGCMEVFASASGLQRMLVEGPDGPAKKEFLQQLGKAETKVSAADLGRAADNGDEFAQDLFKQFGTYLGIGITSLVNILGIHTIVIGGGVSQSWSHFIEATQAEFRSRSYQEVARITQIVPARLGADAGIIGAGLAAMKELPATSRRPRHPVS